MIIETVFGIFLAVAGGGKAEVDPTTTILKMLVKRNEIQKEEKKGVKRHQHLLYLLEPYLKD